MPESYSPAYLVDHLARRASCSPGLVWLILAEHFPWVTPVEYGPDPTGYTLTLEDAAQAEALLWTYLDDELAREFEPNLQPRPRPLRQRAFTPALATTIPQNYSNNNHKKENAI